MDPWCLIYFFVFSVSASADLDNSTAIRKMDTFLSLMRDVEAYFPESSAMSTARLLLQAATTPFHSSLLSERQVSDTKILLTHKVVWQNETGWQEQGVVLAPDGSAVALGPLLGAVVWGWKDDLQCEKMDTVYMNLESESTGLKHKAGTEDSSSSNSQRGLNSDLGFEDGRPVSLATFLGLAFLTPGLSLDTPLHAPDGCWDSISAPRSFKLQDPPSRRDLTQAILNGAMDGAILCEKLKQESKAVPLSALLQTYYGVMPARSPYRRQGFQKLLQGMNLEEEVHRGMICYRNAKAGSGMRGATDDHLKTVAGVAAREFEQRYLECPAVIPRCMWGAKPYKGTPTFLKPPLAQVYIHHTSTPSKPCASFDECSADMRSMQGFHQQDRGWDDIGYSFVAGSDGYLYEGRGWLWVGAHTLGHNSVGYGVSFIGDFTGLLPSEPILSVVRDRFLQCALKSGYTSTNYMLKGHRQLVKTKCPGDSLYKEIQGWKNFKES
ncbi:N-acetylmuramoyl-L-alanine amidase [Pelodytes ibericus]